MSKPTVMRKLIQAYRWICQVVVDPAIQGAVQEADRLYPCGWDPTMLDLFLKMLEELTDTPVELAGISSGVGYGMLSQ